MSKYKTTQQIGNKGEAFFESLISEYAIVHKIDGSKDVGLDFLCEWVYDEEPTRLLFGVQVKTRSDKEKPPKKEPDRSRLNLLPEYRIVDTKIKKDSTLDYWQGFDFPVFLFFVFIDTESNKIDCYYKRYASILHEKREKRRGKEEKEPFYKVNDESKFQAFVHEENFCGGFCRDLYFDHLRCQHNKGMLSGIDPKKLGLSHWSEDALYKGVFDDYKNKITDTYNKYKRWEKYFQQ